jgi:hypothetical protein
MSITPATTKSTKSNWRDDLPVHPAAELFPMLSDEELVKLGEDIKQNGLKHRVVIYEDADHKYWLLDGRNRLDAMKRVGISLEVRRNSIGWEIFVDDDEIDIDRWSDPFGATVVRDVDPYAYVISANYRRRHLDAEERHRIIALYLRREPRKSDRQIGQELGHDHKTIAKVRAEQEDVGSIPHVETRIDTKGRRQPGAKPRKKSEPKSGQQIISPEAGKAAYAAEEDQLDYVAKHANFMPPTECEPPNADKSTKPFDAIVTEVQGVVDTAMDDVPAAEWPCLFAHLHDVLNSLLKARTASRAKSSAPVDQLDIPLFLQRPLARGG